MNEKDAEIAIKYVINKSPNANINELMKDALQYMKEKEKENKKRKEVVKDKNILKGIIDGGKQKNNLHMKA